MNIFQRIANIFRAKTHEVLDKVENPIQTAELKVRDLEISHKNSMVGLAKVKSVHIKYKKTAEASRAKSETYHEKAKGLKTKFEDPKATKAQKTQHQKDIIIMLNKAENMKNDAETQEKLATDQKKIVDDLMSRIKELTTLIKSAKVSITNKKAQSEAAKVNKEVSRELSNSNFDGIKAQLEEIEGKIDADNAEADAWEFIDTEMMEDEDRIDKVLAESSTTEDNKLFEEFMNS